MHNAVKLKGSKTAIALIVDRSGSMQSIQSDATGGINSFIKEQQTVDGECTIRIDQFDNEFEKVLPSTDIKKVESYELVPRGSTALLDAIGKSVSEFALEVKDNKPDNVIVVVVTDGYENASKEWNQVAVKNLIDSKTKDGWNFVYLAANQDAITVGNSYGFAAASSMTYAPTSAGTHNTYASLNSNVTRTRLKGGKVTFNQNDRDLAVSNH